MSYANDGTRMSSAHTGQHSPSGVTVSPEGQLVGIAHTIREQGSTQKQHCPVPKNATYPWGQPSEHWDSQLAKINRERKKES